MHAEPTNQTPGTRAPENRRTALITGASSGIGEAFADVFAAEGFDLVITARRQERLTVVADKLRRQHARQVEVVAADLSVHDAPAKLCDEIARRGLIVDVLVNNAGYGVPGTFNASAWTRQAALLQVMVVALSELTHRVLPGMVDRGYGRIVNVASLAAFVPAPAGHTLYAACKAFVVKFSESLSNEVTRSGVHVTALCPGFTRSEFHDVTGTRAAVRELPSWLWMEALLHEGPCGGGPLFATLRRCHTTGMQSKVHPTYTTKYRVANWPAYNQALVRRGDVAVWLSSEAIAAWTPGRSGRRGGQRRYSDLTIETALTLRLLSHLPLRQAVGFLHALFGMMRLDLSAPDDTTLSRRSQQLRRRLRLVPPGEGLHLVLDSTGLSIVGAGEWAAATHGGRGRRGWRTLHLGVDQSGVIRVHTLTEETGDDATTGLDLLTAVEGPLVRVTADAAYDTVGVYKTAGARGATVVIPPARTANVSSHGPRSPVRDRTITLVKQLGRRQWKKASGYHRQGRVENTFFRYKSIIGDGLRVRSPAGQGSEAVLGCEILNRMTELGRPVSYRIGR